jgi:hypothetical protein
MRYLLIAVLVCSLVVIGATLVGHAIDAQVQDHVLITRNGVTIDCERITDVAGRAFYDSCTRVP